MNLERYNRIQEVLKARQADLTLCLEEVHKPNNVSAVIRTADATGIHKIHAVWPNEMRTLSHTSAGARNWVDAGSYTQPTRATKREVWITVVGTHITIKRRCAVQHDVAAI